MNKIIQNEVIKWKERKNLSSTLSAGVGRYPAGWPIRGQEPDAGERNILHLQTSYWGNVEELALDTEPAAAWLP